MDQTLTKQKTKLTFASAFPKAVQAVFGGELVRITHAGDAEGMSPVYNVIDSEGKSAWVPQSEVRIIDQEYLPLSQEILDSLTQNARGLSGSSTSRSSR